MKAIKKLSEVKAQVLKPTYFVHKMSDPEKCKLCRRNPELKIQPIEHLKNDLPQIVWHRITQELVQKKKKKRKVKNDESQKKDKPFQWEFKEVSVKIRLL